MTHIEWTERTWNPIVGCSVTSPGCKNCYAMKSAARLAAITAKTGKADQYIGNTKKVKGKAVWTGKIGIAPDSTWEQPLRRKTPTLYFVNSMGDLFHPNVDDAQIDRIFAVMALCPQHRFQILTKYPERMRDWFNETYDDAADTRNRVAWQAEVDVMDSFAPDWKGEPVNGPNRCRAIQAGTVWPLPNVWLGVSVEDQQRANARIPLLLDTPAAVRFISAEPLLGPVDLTGLEFPRRYGSGLGNGLTNCAKTHPVEGLDGVVRQDDLGEYVEDSNGLDWVIIGGESGAGARPMHPDWARSLRDQCAMADVPFFFKQWGAWLPWEPVGPPFFRSQNGGYVDGHVAPWTDKDGECLYEDPNCKSWDVDYGDDKTSRLCLFERVGKKAAGRSLDGVTHDGVPEVIE